MFTRSNLYRSSFFGFTFLVCGGLSPAALAEQTCTSESLAPLYDHTRQVFNEQSYLAANPDVVAAIASGKVASAAEHYRTVGSKENRLLVLDEQQYLAANPDISEKVRLGQFASATEHYKMFGKKEDRPLALLPIDFDEQTYLAANPDVKAAIDKAMMMSGAYHYQRYGFREGRKISNSTDPRVRTVCADHSSQGAVAVDGGGSGNSNIANTSTNSSNVNTTSNNATAAATTTSSNGLVAGLENFKADGTSQKEAYKIIGQNYVSSAEAENAYLANNADVKAWVEEQKAKDLKQQGYKMVDGYYAYRHYMLYGVNEGRPFPYFTDGSKDGSGRGVMPTAIQGQEFIEHAKASGERDRAFQQKMDTYLQNNQDVANAVASGQLPNAYYHYIHFGQAEGRQWP